MSVTRAIRNVSASAFLGVVLLVPRPGVDAIDGCRGLGLVGMGDEEEDAIADCIAYGQEEVQGVVRCDSKCEQHCTVADWTTITCDEDTSESGGIWTAVGWCNCTGDPSPGGE